MDKRISELNAHPLNKLSLACLVGYVSDPPSELGVLSLMSAYWTDGGRAHMLKRLSPLIPKQVHTLLRTLFDADPDEVMNFIVPNDGTDSLDIERLGQLDGVDIAAEVLRVIALKLQDGAHLPGRQTQAALF